MCETFEFENFSVISSLCERNIYIKFSDNINFTTYESSLDQKELRLNFALPEIYQIIKKCFQKEEHFNVTISASSNLLRLIFTALVGGILSITFEVQLREKIMSNDAQLTTNFNKMEQKCNYLSRRIDELQETLEEYQSENQLMIEALSNAEIYLGFQTTWPGHCGIGSFMDIICYNINTTEIKISCIKHQQYHTKIYWNKLSKFKCLKKLTIEQCNMTNLKIDIYDDGFSNETLEELEIDCNDYQCQSYFSSLNGIEKFKQLKKLSILHSSSLNNVIESIQKCKKLKTLTLKSCTSINTVEIQTYCHMNKIQLNMS